MSSYGAPDCSICGAHTDYCTLTTATGVDVDCRDLMLRDPKQAEWIKEMWLGKRREAAAAYLLGKGNTPPWEDEQDIASDAT